MSRLALMLRSTIGVRMKKFSELELFSNRYRITNTNLCYLKNGGIFNDNHAYSKQSRI